MEITPESIPHTSFYKLMIGTIVPRPIGWISTLDEHGVPNLAPYSFFNAICSNPPHVLFCPSVRARGDGFKDSLVHVRASGEFVVNIVTEPLAAAMNLTAGEYERGVNEFEIAGVTAAPSLRVRPPRVLESPVNYECVVTQIVEVSDQVGGGSIVIGRVVHLHVADELLLETDKIDILRLQPIGRLAGSGYCRVNDLFNMQRPIVDAGNP
ncbi:flavin reductase family protein [Anaerolineae bacterium CFX9]|nr:flavin reductase family protein [Anaerolineae bacterium CFX9]